MSLQDQQRSTRVSHIRTFDFQWLVSRGVSLLDTGPKENRRISEGYEDKEVDENLPFPPWVLHY